MAKVRNREAQNKPRRTQASRSHVPDPLRAEDKAAVPRPRPNWIRYPAKGVARLFEAVALTCDLAPDAVAHELEEHATTYVPMPDDLKMFADRLAAALSAARHGFPAVPDDGDIFSEYMPWRTRVPLGRFARWVAQEGWTPIPKEFLRLCAPQSGAATSPLDGQPPADSTVSRQATPPTTTRPSDPREQNKMLTMIAAMVGAAYSNSSSDAAASEIVEDAKKIGLSLDKRTALKYLEMAEKYRAAHHGQG
jgi:hypothetical protein